MNKDIANKYITGQSIRQIASESVFSASKVREILLSSGIKMRSSQEGLQIRKENDMPINVEMIERIEGELLGDGCLVKRNCQSKFSFVSAGKEYANWLSNFFVENKIFLSGSGVRKETYFHKNWNKHYIRYTFSTLCSIQFRDLEAKWYINRKKIVPDDLIISPKLVLHWFLGDGSLPKKEFAIFCTDSFSYLEVLTLSNKMNNEIGIISSPNRCGDNYRLFVPKTSVPKLLNYIGSPPLTSMAHKWNLNPIGNINRKKEIAKDVLYDLYVVQNLTQKNLATRFNCSRATIQKKLYEFGIKKRKSNRIFNIDKNEILDLYINQDLTMKDVAQNIGCSLELIKKLLRKNNIRKKCWSKI